MKNQKILSTLWSFVVSGATVCHLAASVAPYQPTKQLQQLQQELAGLQSRLQALSGQVDHKALPMTNDPYGQQHHLNFVVDATVEDFLARGLELFSPDSYDDYHFIQNTLDLGFSVTGPVAARDHGLFAGFRVKGVFGNPGIFNELEPHPVKIGIGRTETEFRTKPKLQNLWLRELWLDLHISNIYRTNLAVGLFPYAVGSGLALGNAHKVGKLIPGYYQERFVDQFRPGLALHGELWQDKLAYSLYGGVIGNWGAHFYDTASFSSAQEPAWRNYPYRGAFTDNWVASIELDFAMHNLQTNINVKPYLIVNKDNYQQVEFPGDATSLLGIIGSSVITTHGRWSLFNEVAVNFGHQKVKAWDRDTVLFVSQPEHTHLFQDFSEVTSETLWRQATTTPFPEDTSFDYGPGVEFYDLCKDTHYKNSFSRFRKNYQNNYDGYMLLSELAYTQPHTFLADSQTTFALLAAYAAGDDNPNDSFEKIMAHRLDGTSCCTFSTEIKYKDYTKTYSGFLGVEQMFRGRTVEPVFLLEAEKLNRPLSALESRLTYPVFSNLAVFGTGAHYQRQLDADRSFNVRLNSLIYWQPYQVEKGYSYTLDTLYQLNSCGAIATTTYAPVIKADGETRLGRFLGWELNCSLDCNFSHNLTVYGKAAAFIPGTYYNSARGKNIPISEQYRLAANDFTGYEISANTKISKYDITLQEETGFILNFGLEYNFDTTTPAADLNLSAQQHLAISRMDHQYQVPAAKLQIPAAASSVTVPTPVAQLAADTVAHLSAVDYQEPVIPPVTLRSTVQTTTVITPQPKQQLSAHTVSRLTGLDYVEPVSAASKLYAGQPDPLELPPAMRLTRPTVRWSKINNFFADPINYLDYVGPVSANITLSADQPDQLELPPAMRLTQPAVRWSKVNNFFDDPINYLDHNLKLQLNAPAVIEPIQVARKGPLAKINLNHLPPAHSENIKLRMGNGPIKITTPAPDQTTLNRNNGKKKFVANES